MTRECATCHGDGVVTVGGVSFNPYVGAYTNDPQCAHDETCPDCSGSGEAAESAAYGPGNPDWEFDFDREGRPT